jgi:Domain of unknown function (DUF6378)
MTHTQKNEPTPGTEILQQAYNIVNQDRQNTYGHPKDDYTKVTNIFETLTGKQLTLTEALLFMVSVKLARLKTNLDQGQLHHDTLLDTIGYLTCLNMIHQPESTTNDTTTKNTRPTNPTTTKRNKTTPKRNPTTTKTTNTPKKVDKNPKTR